MSTFTLAFRGIQNSSSLFKAKPSRRKASGLGHLKFDVTFIMFMFLMEFKKYFKFMFGTRSLVSCFSNILIFRRFVVQTFGC